MRGGAKWGIAHAAPIFIKYSTRRWGTVVGDTVARGWLDCLTNSPNRQSDVTCINPAQPLSPPRYIWDRDWDRDRVIARRRREGGRERERIGK